MHQTWLYRARMLDHAHHTEGWAATRRTDIDEMALACGPDNRLVEKGWTTRKNARATRSGTADASGLRATTNQNFLSSREVSRPPMRSRVRPD
jgi:hypothetical protein